MMWTFSNVESPLPTPPYCMAGRWWRNGLYHSVAVKLFQKLFYTSHEGSAMCSVNNPVIIAHGQVHSVANSNHIPILCLHHYRPFFNNTGTKNGDLRLVDNGGSHQISDTAVVGYCDGASHQDVGVEVFLTGFGGEIID